MTTNQDSGTGIVVVFVLGLCLAGAFGFMSGLQAGQKLERSKVEPCRCHGATGQLRLSGPTRAVERN